MIIACGRNDRLQSINRGFIKQRFGEWDGMNILFKKRKKQRKKNNFKMEKKVAACTAETQNIKEVSYAPC